MSLVYKYITMNKSAIEKSHECACVYCLKKINPKEITKYCCDKNTSGVFVQETAICPYCGIDAVVPDSLVKYTNTDLVKWNIDVFEAISNANC